MGQGADSCGGDGCDYDEGDAYSDALLSGNWIQRDGSEISISKMTVKHLEGAKRIAERARDRASFSSASEMWGEWVDAFDDELMLRHLRETPSKPTEQARYINGDCKKETRGAKANMQCHCGGFYLAREADLARGWAKSCSKRCASIRRDYGRPEAKRVKDESCK